MVKPLADPAHVPMVFDMYVPCGVSVDDSVQGTMPHEQPGLLRAFIGLQWAGNYYATLKYSGCVR